MADINLTHTGAQLDEAIARSLQSPVDLSAVTAKAADVLEGKIIVNADGAVVGTMPNWGAVEAEATSEVPYTIPAGYHNGAGVVTGSGGGAVANSIVITEVNANKRITKVDVSSFTEIYPYMFYNYNASTGAYIYLIDIIMPANITAIESSAFKNCTYLALTSLPEGLISIGDSAFSSCTNLALTSLPNGLESIGSSAFSTCYKLALTSLPNGLSLIGNAAFYYCTNITLTSLPDGWESISSSAFSGCTKLALTSLPNGLTSIGSSAFQGCSNITLTSLPNGLSLIDNGTFYGCTNITLTSLPNGVTSIGDTAFKNCTNLALTSLPNGLESIGDNAFQGCASLTEIWVPISCTTITASSYSKSPFYQCSASLIIYCEAESKPAGWGAYWNYYSSSGQLTVNWGISKEAFDALP